ncbi:MAG TPA: YfhO family protein, partial [Candidatus Kapabacteria bacterium]|nr:YfhO family protein [Candidatus Kapabacteria bacterium]
GAILSLYIAAWLFFIWFLDGPQKGKQLGKATIFVAIMAIASALLSAQTLRTLVTTQIQGVSGTQQDTKTKGERWDWATQWSMPKMETLRVFVPGLYGYRMDTPEGGEYWGAVGQQPGWEKHHQGLPRHSGAGEYAGVLVCVLALYGIACALGKSKALADLDRRIIWFWVVVGIISLLLSFGRHAPFYKILYSLPYFSTIRNPIKFMLPFQMALLVLFGFGLQCLYRKYEQSAVQTAKSATAALSAWWKNAAVYEKRYGQLVIGLLAVSLFGYLIYYSSAREVRSYIASSGFSEANAAEIHKFSLSELRWTILFLAASAAIVLLALAGWFSGPRTKWLTAAVGLVLVLDLYRANTPWVVYYDYKLKYQDSSLLAALKDHAHERRVTAKFHPMAGYLSQLRSAQGISGPQSQALNALYNDWIQHQFQYFRIHSLDISQMPRVPELDSAYMSAFMPRSENQLSVVRRLWELTNTRWILAEKGFVQYLNQAMDPQKNRFRLHSEFNFAAKEGVADPISYDQIKAEIVPNGPFAIIEFTGALPRTKFFTNWSVMTDDAATLAELGSETFDPQEKLLVSGSVPALSTNAVATGTNTVQVLSYQPREWKIEVENSAPGILLLNDKFDADWSVTVSGQPATMLRCNYIMRGVPLSPGKHTVVFTYRVSSRGLFVSLASIIAGVGISLFLGFNSRRTGHNDPVKPGAAKTTVA